MSGGGFRPAARYVVLRAGSVVIDTASEWDADKRIGYQTVTLELPNGTGTIELRAETRVAGALATALAGLEPVTEDALPGCDRPAEPQGALYRVKGYDFFGDLVIEVPPTVTAPGAVATWLAERASLMVRHQIGGEYEVDVMVDLDGGFASVAVDGGPGVRYPLVEASRTEIGGAS